jgi:hypothetical protein
MGRCHIGIEDAGRDEARGGCMGIFLWGLSEGLRRWESVGVDGNVLCSGYGRGEHVGWYPVLQAVKQHCGVEALNGDGKAMIVERGGM